MELPEEKKEEGRSAPGKLVIDFISVGQGDSTVIRCPTGEIFVIDLGTTEPQLGHSPREFFESADIFGKDKTLDALILTHSDEDHYNSILLLYTLGVGINAVYHSNSLPRYKTTSSAFLSKKTRSDTSSNLLRFMCKEPEIKEVTLNDEQQYYVVPNKSKFEKQDIKTGAKIGDYVDGKGILIHSKSGCDIYLLSGNVEDPKAIENARSAKRQKTDTKNNYEIAIEGSKNVNSASIITLIEYKGKRCLICGDATGVTEAFILKKYPALQDIEILRIPHHGSDTYESSSANFIKKMNPRNIVISVPKESASYSHPRCGIIQRYVDNCTRLVKKDDDTTVADSTTYGCYYISSVGPADASHTKFMKESESYYNPSKTSNANIYITGRDGNKRFEIT